MAGLDGFGAGRFLPGGIPDYTQQQVEQSMQMPGPSMAFQPNYDLFFNPYRMLEMGQPYFGGPWYSSMSVPEMAPQMPQPVAQPQVPQVEQLQQQMRAQGMLANRNPDVPGSAVDHWMRKCAQGNMEFCGRF